MSQRLTRANKTYYLDDSDEEVIDEQILDIVYYDHFPTLVERWGDETKLRIRYEGDVKIEDFVEFEELEPTETDEITYEMVMVNDEVQSYRTISHFRSRTRNFRQLKKRRIKRQRKHRVENEQVSSSFSSVNVSPINDRANQLLDQMINLSHQINSIVEETNCNDDRQDQSLIDKHEVDSSLLSTPPQMNSITHINESDVAVLSIQSDSIPTQEDYLVKDAVIQSSSLDMNNGSVEQLNLQSFPIHSNLPCNDYTLVFGGISNDVIHVIDDLTKRVDQTLSKQYESVHQRYDQLLDHLQRLETILSHVSMNSTQFDQQTSTLLTTKQAVNSLTFYDEYPWYINHYSIIDAENQFYQHFSSSKSTVEPSVENDDGEPFQLVQRRKRVPSSSTTKQGQMRSTMDESISSNISAAIDLTPIVLHGHPIIPSIVTELPDDTSKPVAVVPQTTKSKKKKKKNKSVDDEFFFEAPVPSVSDTAYTSMTSNVDHDDQGNSTSADASNTFPTSSIDDPTQDTSFAASSIDESSFTESLPATTSSKKKRNKQKKKNQQTQMSSEIVQEEPKPVIVEESESSTNASTTTAATHVEDEQSSKTTKRRKKRSHTKPMESAEHSPPTADESNLTTESSLKPASTDVNESKLDLFLPNYIRDQMKTNTTSNPINPKRKTRPKMLLKDHEAKDLLTHEFDTNSSPTTKTIDNEDPLRHETSTDSILTRGFRRWLAESYALIAPPSNSTSGIHGLLIQPGNIDNDDENDIEIKHTQQSPTTKQSFYAHPSNLFDYTSESLVEPTEDDLSSMNYDDWGYFFHDDDEHRSVEHSCFYARAYNDDTFVSDIVPANSQTLTHSIDQQHSYEDDFHVSRSSAQISDSRQVKPSEVYRQWRRNLSQS